MKNEVYDLLKEIEELIMENEDADGHFCFDQLRVMVALDFVKSEIKKSILEERIKCIDYTT